MSSIVIIEIGDGDTVRPNGGGGATGAGAVTIGDDVGVDGAVAARYVRSYGPIRMTMPSSSLYGWSASNAAPAMVVPPLLPRSTTVIERPSSSSRTSACWRDTLASGRTSPFSGSRPILSGRALSVTV